MAKVLVISPHPDDEAIGCGGTIAQHIHNGDMVEVVFLTSGEKGGHGRSENETNRIREQEARDAAEILSISNIEFWREPDGSFTASPENVNRFKNKLQEYQPDIIYVPHDAEDHPDHRAAALMVKTAVEMPGFSNLQVWMYEVWTPIQKLELIVDISEFVDIKRKAIKAHKCQCDVLKFDEAALALNRYRGEMHSWPGGDYAEVFTK